MHALNIRIMQPFVEWLSTANKAASVSTSGEEWEFEEIQKLLNRLSNQ
jgi:hypothetical protein